MADLDLDQLLSLLRDPHSESQAIAAQVGVPREEAGRAARLLMALNKAKPEEVLSLPGPLAAAMARAAFAASRVDLLSALAGHSAKDVAKEAKRCLHLLKIRGVLVPEAPRPAAPSPATLPAEAPLSALASSVDARGERAVWLPRSLPGRGVEVAQAILGDDRGLLELQVGVLGRKEWRALAKDLLERGAAGGVVEISRERAHAFIAAARALNERTGQRVPDGTDIWLYPLGPAPALPPPGAELVPLSEEEERKALSTSDRLHGLPGFKGWLADQDFLRKVAAKLDEVQVSPLYIDERQRAGQAEHVVSEAVEEYLDPAHREKLAARLLAAGDHLLALGLPEAARSAAAASRALAEGVPGRDIPFARLLVEKPFAQRSPAPTPAESAPLEPSGSSLIIAPR